MSDIANREACKGDSSCLPYLEDFQQKFEIGKAAKTEQEAYAICCPPFKKAMDCISTTCYAAVIEESAERKEAMAVVNKKCAEFGFPEAVPGSKSKGVGGNPPKSSPSPSLVPKQGSQGGSTSPSNSTDSLGFTLSMTFTLFLAILL
jgi:hypothetical protein